MAVKILIDSASDITVAEGKELGLTVLPIEVNFGGETYMDGETIFADEFYKKLETASELPKTSQINGYRFEEEFKKHIDNGDEVVYLSLSSKISGTYNNARLTAEQFENKAYAVDTLNATAGMRILALYALRLVSEGKTAKEIAEELEKKKSKVRVIAMIDTLKYLKMGGRISSAAAIVCGLMNLKPMISVVDGEVKVIGKCVGVKKAIQFINQAVKESGGIDMSMPYCNIVSGNDLSNYDKYIETSTEIYGEMSNKVPVHKLGATIGTHVGPGAVGAVFFAN